MRSSSAPGVTTAGRAGSSRRLRSGRDLAFRVADVVVVRAERDVGVLQLRIAALDDADDVLRELRADDLVVGVDVEGQRHAVEPERRQRLPRLGLPLQLVVFDGRVAEEKLEERIAAGRAWRHGRVEPLGRGEVGRWNGAAATACGLSRGRAGRSSRRRGPRAARVPRQPRRPRATRRSRSGCGRSAGA